MYLQVKISFFFPSKNDFPNYTLFLISGALQLISSLVLNHNNCKKKKLPLKNEKNQFFVEYPK